MPLIIAPPTSAKAVAKAGGRCERAVSLLDLFPTLIDLCGLPAKGDLDGQSLVPLLAEPTRPTRPAVSTFDHQNYSIRDDRWRLIHYRDGSEELYDHDADPHEWRNLADDPAHAPTRSRLRESLPATAAARLGPDSQEGGGGD